AGCATRARSRSTPRRPATRKRSALPGSPQLRRARSLVLPALGVLRALRAPREQVQLTAASGVSQDALHEPILARVVGEGDDRAAGLEELDRGGHALDERGELVVHEDAERLEGAARRVDARVAVAIGLAHDRGELRRRLDGQPALDE